ncbi:MAG: PaaX family transcriptional regulator C-terminal domain-containing protein [Microbacterium sp.]|uniref:PaaX family transcriptional regulator n=1 Tax=Microbacterium sp. TaxID=51671 RepID=UPI0039E6639D
MPRSSLEPSTGTRRTKTWLLTLLGEAVLPLTRYVWQGSLVDGLVALGASTAAARQTVSRAIADGWLISERVGRRSRLAINDSAAIQLREGRARTLSFGQPQEWDGRWLLVALTVPEDSRSMRYHFRTELAWLGFGSMGNGLWISPHAVNEAATTRLFASVDGPQGAYVFTHAEPANRSPREIAAEAWDLENLRTRYEGFIEHFTQLAPSTPDAVFVAWVDLFTRWRHFPLFDPELPDSLLPADWPRSRAHALFHRLIEQWTAEALDYFHELESRASGA